AQIDDRDGSTVPKAHKESFARRINAAGIRVAAFLKSDRQPFLGSLQRHHADGVTPGPGSEQILSIRTDGEATRDEFFSLLGDGDGPVPEQKAVLELVSVDDLKLAAAGEQGSPVRRETQSVERLRNGDAR